MIGAGAQSLQGEATEAQPLEGIECILDVGAAVHEYVAHGILFAPQSKAVAEAAEVHAQRRDAEAGELSGESYRASTESVVRVAASIGDNHRNLGSAIGTAEDAEQPPS